MVSTTFSDQEYMRTTNKAVLAAIVLALTPMAAGAQQTTEPALETGTWTGVVTPPDGEIVNVTYDVAVRNDGALAIVINAGQHGTFAASDIKTDAAKLSFAFTPGPRVVCMLARKNDKSYEGDCSDDNGAPAHMTMVPPRKEPAGN
ncbi:MAG TPA: hypothetical protein VF021_09655 [Longimicrobiales bacterium]